MTDLPYTYLNLSKLKKPRFFKSHFYNPVTMGIEPINYQVKSSEDIACGSNSCNCGTKLSYLLPTPFLRTPPGHLSFSSVA